MDAEVRTIIRPTKCGLADIDQLAPFLLERIAMVWPGRNPQSWITRLKALLGSNQHHLVRTENAAGLAACVFHPLTGVVRVDGVFLWSSLNKKEAEPEIVGICREFERWGRVMGASEFRPGDQVDGTPGRLAELLRADRRECLVRVLK